MKEGIKANRHKAIDRGRSSRSLMAWKNSESQANFALWLGAGRGSCAPDTPSQRIKNTAVVHRTWSPLFLPWFPWTPRASASPLFVLQRVTLSRCGRLNVTTRGNDAESNSARCR